MASKWLRDSVKSGVFNPMDFTTISDIEDDEETDVLDTTAPMLDKTIRDSVPRFDIERQNRKRQSNQKSVLSRIWQELTLNRGQNVTTFTILCALSGCFAHSVGTYISTQMSSLQKQFGLSSTQGGLITSCNDIGFFLVILLASQFANDSHIPRTLTRLTIVFGIAVCEIGMAYFFRPIARLGNSTLRLPTPELDILCLQEYNQVKSIATSEQECHLIFQGNWKRSHIAFSIFIVCMIVQGMCKAPRSSFVPVYIDNNVAKKTRSGIYFVLLFSISMIGPALIFSLGAFINKIPVDFIGRGVIPGDPGWIGAWWLGFIVIGTMSVLITLPLVCFPRNIPKEPFKLGRHLSGLDAGVESFIADSLKSTEQKSRPFKKIVKDFFSSITRVLKKPVYTTILISDSILLFSLVGIWTFLPKYIEEQFRIPSWKTNLILALVTVLSSVIGLTLGGILSYRLKLQPRRLIKVKVCCLLICVGLEVPRLFLHCGQPYIQNNPYDIRSFNSSTIRSFADCGCDPNKFFPVCGVNNENYFSPCHAGCINGDHRHFSECSAIPGRKSWVGLCQNRCDNFNLFILITFLLNLVKSVDIVPSYIVIMRSQQEKDKQLGISIFSAALSLLSFLPGPISFGYLVDSTCYLWDQTCGVRGHCKIYQLQDLHKLLFGSLLVGRVGALFFCCISLICAIKISKQSNVVYTKVHTEEKCSEF